MFTCAPQEPSERPPAAMGRAADLPFQKMSGWQAGLRSAPLETWDGHRNKRTPEPDVCDGSWHDIRQAIEPLLLHERMVLHSRHSGAVVFSDSLGFALLESLAAGDTDALRQSLSTRQGFSAEDADALLYDIRKTWHVAGLLAPAPPAFDLNTTRLHAGRRGITLDFAHGRLNVRVRCDCEDIAMRTARTFGAYVAHPSEEALHTIDVVQEDGRVTIVRDGRPAWHSTDGDSARFILFQEIIGILGGEENVGAVIHGALVVRDGKGMILAGPSGRGKTTLALALANAGWTYASDDLFALHQDGLHAIALPMRAHVKPRATRGLLPMREYRMPRRSVEPGSMLRIDCLVFPSYSEGQASDRRAIDPAEALQILLQSGTEPSRRNRSLRPLADLVKDVRAVGLSYGSTSAGVSACAALARTELS